MGIEEQIDKLIDLGEDIKSRLDLLVKMATDHFAGADKMVAEEPAKKPEPEHPAGPMPDPGEGYRILSKNPPEDLTPGDEFEDWNGKWIRSSNAETDKKQGATCWYRRKIDQPEPAWEPKVGDWVRVTRPENWEKCWSPCWLAEMHQFDGKVGCIERVQGSCRRIRGFVGSDALQYQFHSDWLSPAEPPAKEEPKKWRILHPGESVRASDWENEDLNSETDPPDGPGWRPASMWKNGRSVLKNDKCIYARPVADEPAKKWRILEPGEVVCSSDWICARSNLPSDPPNGFGWKPQICSTGISVSKHDDCVFARPVAEEPANQPTEHPEDDHFAGANKMVAEVPAKESVEHPAVPKPWPGKGYRILSKDPDEDLRPGDEYELATGAWVKSTNAARTKIQSRFWYRRKIEPAEPPQPEYREPVLPADAGKMCEFSEDGKVWTESKLRGYAGHLWQSVSSSEVGAKVWVHARIKKDA